MLFMCRSASYNGTYCSVHEVDTPGDLGMHPYKTRQLLTHFTNSRGRASAGILNLKLVLDMWLGIITRASVQTFSMTFSLHNGTFK
jgi:hypothetical protein